MLLVSRWRVFVNLELSDTTCTVFILFLYVTYYPILPQIGPPTYPRRLRITSVQPTSVDVAWDKLESSQQNGIITGYSIHVRSNIKSITRTKDYLVNNAFTTTFRVTGLESDTVHSISISALNDLREFGPNSPLVTVTTLPEGMFIRICLSVYCIL